MVIVGQQSSKSNRAETKLMLYFFQPMHVHRRLAIPSPLGGGSTVMPQTLTASPSDLELLRGRRGGGKQCKLCTYLSTDGFEYKSLGRKAKRKQLQHLFLVLACQLDTEHLAVNRQWGEQQLLDQLTAVTPLLRNKLTGHPTGFQPPAKRGLSLKKTCFQYFAPNILYWI